MSERIVAIVPIRSWHNGKTRLAPVLSPEARSALMARAAAGVVKAAAESGVMATVLVVSADAEVLVWADRLGAPVTALPHPDELVGLNGAIEAGRMWARERGMDAVLSLFADLPLLEADDVRQMVARPESVVLGPDRNREGTNALLLRLADDAGAFSFRFGEGSLARHEAEAKRLGLTFARVERAGIGFDLDTPQDWADFLDIVSEIGLYPALEGAWTR